MMQEFFLEALIDLGASFGVGLYIAMSPCLFPLLPLFLIRNLQAETSRRRSLLVTGILTLGILVSLGVFILISSIIGTFLLQNFVYIQTILGIIIIILGILTLSETLREKLRLTNISITSDPGDPKSLIGVFSVGFTYSLLAAPCSGTAILGLIVVFSTVNNPLLIVMMYITLAIAVSIPYLAIALVTGEARDRMATRLAKSARVIEVVVGSLLIILGLYLTLSWYIIL